MGAPDGSNAPHNGPFAVDPRNRCEEFMTRYDVQVLLNRIVSELAENQPDEPIPFLKMLLGELEIEHEQQILQQASANAEMFNGMSDEQLNEAALRIQSVHRGRQARKRVEGIRESLPPRETRFAEDEAPAAPEAVDGALEDLGMPSWTPEEANAAVLKIQSIQRGRQARRRVEGIRLSKTEETHVATAVEAFDDLTSEEAEAAVLKIQTIHRGRQARKRVEGIKAQRLVAGATTEEVAQEAAQAMSSAFDGLSPEEVEAAVLKIQAIQRGRLARKRVMGIKQQEELNQGTEVATEAMAELTVEGAAEAEQAAEIVSAAFDGLTPEEAAEAVLKIQTIARGRAARKRVAGIRAERVFQASQGEAAAAEAPSEAEPAAE